MNIALATCDNFHDLLTDDELLREELIKLGHKAPSVSWSDKNADWMEFDTVIVRSTWDYYKHLPAFTAWLHMLEQSGISTWNPPALMRWNSNKTYLRDLEQRGITIVPTVWIEQDNNKQLSTILQESGWKKAVLKPTVSAGSYLTVPIDISNADEHHDTLEKILQLGTGMLQPFLAEVQSVGEYSFLFFGKDFQYAVLKSPKAGDYRVQQEFGGNTVKIEPTEKQLATAHQVIKAIKSPTLYARVDAVEVNGQLQLMELELIEPFLFLEYQDGAAASLASMIDDWVR